VQVELGFLVFDAARRFESHCLHPCDVSDLLGQMNRQSPIPTSLSGGRRALLRTGPPPISAADERHAREAAHPAR
jgi:hypothetical protein